MFALLFLTTGYESIGRKEEGWIIMLKYHLKRSLLKVLKVVVSSKALIQECPKG